MSGMLMTAKGSIASFWSSANYFRSSPANGHRQGRSPCLKGAISGSRLIRSSSRPASTGCDGHSGSPARRNPSSYRERSSARR